MIQASVMNKYRNPQKVYCASFNPYHDDWHYQDLYNKVDQLPKDLSDDCFEEALVAASSAVPKLHPDQMELLLDDVREQFGTGTKYIDPPEGWKYGFPKPLPSGVEDILAWLISEGYPKSTMDLYGDAFTYRVFVEEE